MKLDDDVYRTPQRRTRRATRAASTAIGGGRVAPLLAPLKKGEIVNLCNFKR